MEESTEENVFPIIDIQSSGEKFFPYSTEMKTSNTAIVIDNGSYQCKAGWASDKEPCLVFRNLVAKNRNKKDHDVQVGNDIANTELLCLLLKTQFDRNVVTQFDVQELIFDHIFNHLGINTSGCVDHPIVLTEAICNPSYSRQLMSELLFECYQVPSIAYGIDAMYSFNYNNSKYQAQNGLIISSSYNTTHILPVMQGQIDFPQCRRINVGGNHLITFLHRALQLKYPTHFSAINKTRCERLIHKHMKVALNYQEELKKWNDLQYYNKHVHKIQLPFTHIPGALNPVIDGKMERCFAMLKRLQELNAEKRAESLIRDEEKLQHFLNMQEILEDDEEDVFLQKSLHEFGLTSANELQIAINKLNQKIRKTRNYIPYFSFGESDVQDPAQKQNIGELELYRFSDPESWIKAIKQKCEELKKSKQKLDHSSPSKNKAENNRFQRKTDPISGNFKQVDIQNIDDSEITEEEKIQELEVIIREYDREFNRNPFTGTESSLSFSLADYYQLHLGIEQIRIPEIFFQPSIIGVDQAGIAETLEMVLACYSTQTQLSLVENVFLTGGCVSIPGFKERIQGELLAMRPFQSVFHINMAIDPVLDGWHGAQQWAFQNNNLKIYSMTKAEYQERGGDYFKQHSASNKYMPVNKT